MARRAAVFLILILIFLGLGSTAAAGKGQEPTQEILALLERINQEREAAAASRLELDYGLSAVAAAHALEMRELGYYGHFSPVTGSPGNRLRSNGIQFTKMSENIAAGYDPDHAFRRLLDSKPHRAALLDGAYQQVGMALVDAGPYIYLVQVLIASQPVE